MTDSKNNSKLTTSSLLLYMEDNKQTCLHNKRSNLLSQITSWHMLAASCMDYLPTCVLKTEWQWTGA